ncbi:cytochrome P450 [Leptodontidium sp. MPI-SDFR-AT-0119]|nr:cytochrome P450 [Leptodontidium sp. MPI-SDFR-AT-0119]
MDPMPGYKLVCLSLLLLIALYHLIKSAYRKEKHIRLASERGCGQPPETPNILFGLLQIIQLLQALRQNRFLDYINELFSNHGNTFSYNTLGTQSIWTTDPENIRACLSTQSQDFEVGATRHKVIIPLVGHSILTSDGKIWSQHRALLRPNFMKAQLVDLGIFERHFSNFVTCVPKDSSTFDLRGLLQKLTMDISTDFLLGCSTNSLVLHAYEERDEFAQAWKTAMSWIALRAHLGALMDWIPHPSFFKSCGIIHAYADELVRTALASGDKLAGGEQRYIFLHELAKEVTDPVQLRDHVISILTAGRDTTAELLSCTVNVLARCPHILNLLRDEVDQLGGQKPTTETLKEMKYLQNVFFEVLRLYPIGPVNARIAKNVTTLPVGGGPQGTQPIMVKKGQQVMYCVYGMHRRQDIYGQDAGEFRPERWESRRQGWDFLPFNGGARQCLGQSFAMMEASYILVRLLQEFDGIEQRDSRPWQEHLGLILSNLHGTLVGLKRKSGADSKGILMGEIFSNSTSL